MMKSWMSLRVTEDILLAVLICLLGCSSACFIRNCPLGGKRSSDHMASIPRQRECMTCGPQNLGQCIGPNICCSPSFGCYMNTMESQACEKENSIPTACEVRGQMCGKDDKGNCVADGICCTDGNCALESRCDMDNEMYPTVKRHADLSPELLKYIHRLLAHKRR